VKIVYSDVLVVGGGLAGLRVAIGVRRRGLDAIVLSLVPAKRSHSAAAQGGMQASLGNAIKGAGDNEDVHFEDTVRGSDWGAAPSPEGRTWWSWSPQSTESVQPMIGWMPAPAILSENSSAPNMLLVSVSATAA